MEVLGLRSSGHDIMMKTKKKFMFVAQLSSVHLYNDQINEKIKMNMN